MKKRLVLLLSALLLTLVLSPMSALADATFSDCWVQDAAGNWKVQNADGSFVKNAWFCDDAVPGNGQDCWYLLDGDGNMITAGLVQDGTGNYYSLETGHNGYFGMLRHTPGTYDGVYLNLEFNHSGAFAAIKNPEGVAALNGIYGTTRVSIDNSNCVYSSQIVAARGKNEPIVANDWKFTGVYMDLGGGMSFVTNDILQMGGVVAPVFTCSYTDFFFNEHISGYKFGGTWTRMYDPDYSYVYMLNNNEVPLVAGFPYEGDTRTLWITLTDGDQYVIYEFKR